MANPTKPWVRLVIAGVGLGTVIILARLATGHFIPTDPDEALLFQGTLLLVVFGSSLIEQHFTRPAEALVNSVAAMVTLVGSYATAPHDLWWIVVAFLATVAIAATTCVALQASTVADRQHSRVQRACYNYASVLGRARILFSVVFLFAIAFFLSDRDEYALALVAFWGIYVAMWPLGVPALLSAMVGSTKALAVVGVVDRIDSPGLARVALSVDDAWRWPTSGPVIAHLHDHSTRWAIPLFSEERPDGRWGTVLLADRADTPWHKGGLLVRPAPGTIRPSITRLMESLTGESEAQLVGVVREGSTIAELRVEVLPYAQLGVGQVLAVLAPASRILYQVVGARTDEEAFGGLRYGSVVASAVQIGSPDDSAGLSHYPWVPLANTQVFSVPASYEVGPDSDGDEFLLGHIAGTAIPLRGEFLDHLQSHTAVLGATGSGKTEFALDLAKYAADRGVKVICIDLTAQYAHSMTGSHVQQLTMPDELAQELSDKLFAVETGKYGAGDEKQALEQFAQPVRDSVMTDLTSFLQSASATVGLLELREISNTKASLWITETYLTSLLKLAREGGLGGKKVLVVVEEAHTVMPEPGFVGVGDYDSRATVSKIAQVALQGRKYGVGLLVIAQRTATVSKTVLTQCNTVVSFSCIDDTSINFLRNVFGEAMSSSLPELKKLRAIAHGDWINAEKPVVFDVPYSAAKAAGPAWSGPAVGTPSSESLGDPVLASTETPDDEPPF